eukprot:2787205-Pleurochrysis_carterae.AAC.1
MVDQGEVEGKERRAMTGKRGQKRRRGNWKRCMPRLRTHDKADVAHAACAHVLRKARELDERTQAKCTCQACKTRAGKALACVSKHHTRLGPSR